MLHMSTCIPTFKLAFMCRLLSDTPCECLPHSVASFIAGVRGLVLTSEVGCVLMCWHVAGKRA